MDLAILYFFAKIVDDRPPELAIYFIFPLFLTRFGNNVELVKLPAPTIPIIAFYFMYRWEKLKNKSKNLTLITGVGVSIVGILLIIALLID